MNILESSRTFRRRFLCLTLFLFGGAAGCLTARLISNAAGLETWERAVSCASASPFLTALVWNVAVPACVAFCAGCVAGFLLIPAIELLFGFAYGFMAVLAIRYCGPVMGLCLALCAGGCVPGMIWLSVSAIRVSSGLCAAFRSGGKRTFDGAGDAARMAAALAALAAFSVLEALILRRMLG